MPRELLSEKERDELALWIYRQSVSPIVHQIASLEDDDPKRERRMLHLTEAMQGCAMASLNAAEQYTAVHIKYRMAQDEKRGKAVVITEDVEVASSIPQANVHPLNPKKP